MRPPAPLRPRSGAGGFAAALRALGEALRAPELEHGDDPVCNAELDPRLRTTYSPRASWRDPHGFGPARGPSMPEWARVWGYGPPAADLGLSLAPNSKRPARYGLSGLPSAGRKAVWRALALLEDDRRLLSFWTVSLPTAALIALGQADSWALFQDRVRKELSRKLQAAGIRPRIVGVVELQPQRTRATGMPCPHLHVVFQGRKSPTDRWALRPTDLDGVIAAALATAGVPAPDGIDGQAFLKAAGNIQQVKKSVRAYLSKYMTKGGNDTAPHRGGAWEALLPRQWWFWSAVMRAEVLAHVFPIAFPFLLWVHENRMELQSRELIRVRVLDLPDPRAPVTYEVGWLSVHCLAQLVAIWQLDSWDAEWMGQHRVFQWQLSRSQASPAASIPTNG